ncbi:hypothetical protein GCM10027085_32920 [Spirosoma aerophilum]
MATTKRSQTSEFATWQTEISQLYRNYHQIGLMLSQPISLSIETRLTLQYLKKELVKAVERFNNDFDKPTDCTAKSQTTVLKKHANTMHYLNRSIEDLVTKHAYC